MLSISHKQSFDYLKETCRAFGLRANYDLIKSFKISRKISRKLVEKL